MLCSISGVAPNEPVFSAKSGHVFEKRLIVKHLKATNTCPVTNEPLSEVDLVPVKGNPNVAPRAPSGTSLPSMIQNFQNEWDALMLESFSLKKHLATVQQELAHALYQHDAACRVIARLIKERDEARQQLGDAQSNVAGAIAAGSTAAGIAGAAGKVLAATAKDLSKSRRKKVKAAAANVKDAASLASYACTSSHPLHSASKPGVLCLDLSQQNQDVAVTGGADGNAIVYNFKTQKIVDTLKGHKKKITDVAFHNSSSTVFTTSEDKTAIIWNADSKGKYAKSSVLADHSGAVVGCSVHPSGSYLVTASQDKSWNFYDIETAACVQKVADKAVTAAYSKVKFHPDGLYLGLGTDDSLVRMIDVKSQKQVAALSGHSGSISALTFSENGYYLSSGDSNGVVKMWDLRHLDKELNTVNDKKLKTIGDLSFDSSGTYLGVAGVSTFRVYNPKSLELVKEWTDHTKAVTGIRFGPDASFLATTSLDRSLKIFGN